MANWIEITIEWIEKHPVNSSLILATLTGISGLALKLISDRRRDRIRLIIEMTLGRFEISSKPKGITVFSHFSIGFKIMIMNPTKNQVTVSKFFLELPSKLKKVKELRIRYPGLLSFGKRIRMYQNYFQLTNENGVHKPVPFELSRVDYLFGGIDDDFITSHLDKSDVRFGVTDQGGKTHFSNYFRIDKEKFMDEIKNGLYH